jgi:hypothetical protein
MRTVNCRHQAGGLECNSKTLVDRAYAVHPKDGAPGVHHECETGHKFHLDVEGIASACNCPLIFPEP